jgi:hypothetical protein
MSRLSSRPTTRRVRNGQKRLPRRGGRPRDGRESRRRTNSKRQCTAEGSGRRDEIGGLRQKKTPAAALGIRQGLLRAGQSRNSRHSVRLSRYCSNRSRFGASVAHGNAATARTGAVSHSLGKHQRALTILFCSPRGSGLSRSRVNSGQFGSILTGLTRHLGSRSNSPPL